MIMGNPYRANLDARVPCAKQERHDHSIWEEGRAAGKAEQAEMVKGLVEILGDMVRDAELNHGKVTHSASQAAGRAIAKAKGE